MLLGIKPKEIWRAKRHKDFKKKYLYVPEKSLGSHTHNGKRLE